MFISGQGYLVNRQNPIHPIELEISQKNQELNRYITKRNRNQRIKRIEEYKAKFAPYDYTYVPAFAGKPAAWNEWKNTPGHPEHFIFNTKIKVKQTANAPKGWAKTTEKVDKKSIYGYGGYYDIHHILVRPLPEGYPEGQIPEEKWDETLQILQKVGPYIPSENPEIAIPKTNEPPKINTSASNSSSTKASSPSSSSYSSFTAF